MSSHTPGPWYLRDIRSNGGSRREFIIFPARDELNAVALAIHPRECNGPKITEAEAEANAHLIAASPELLAGLRWAIRMMQGESGAGDSYWDQFPEYVAACKAIEKAEGV